MCTQTENHCAECGLVDTSLPISTCPAACTHENTLWRRKVRVYLERCQYCLHNVTIRAPAKEIASTLAGSVASPSGEEVDDGVCPKENRGVPVVLRIVEEGVWRPTWHHGRGVLRPEMRWQCLVSGVSTTSRVRRRSSLSRISKLKGLRNSPLCKQARTRQCTWKKDPRVWTVQFEDKKDSEARSSDE